MLVFTTGMGRSNALMRSWKATTNKCVNHFVLTGTTNATLSHDETAARRNKSLNIPQKLRINQRQNLIVFQATTSGSSYNRSKNWQKVDSGPGNGQWLGSLVDLTTTKCLSKWGAGSACWRLGITYGVY